MALLACLTGMAQVATTRLEGLVLDATGSIVPGARVMVVNARTEAHAEILVDLDGRFVFPSLQPGVYTLSAEATGFRKALVSGLVLNVGDTVSETVSLEIGAVTESVDVKAGRERVQINDAQIARATTLREIDVLPQLERTPMSLAIFNPGVQIDPTEWYSLSRVNGTRQGSNNTRLDGIDANDGVTPRLLLSSTANNPDSVEEFRIVTSGGKAEYGRSAGGQIEMITRSGGNTLHGNLFEYHRNTVLNANTFFGNSTGLDRPVYIRNTFGGSLGGPVRRERTFFFGSYQGQRTAQEIVRNRLVLTPEAKTGLFRWRLVGSTSIRAVDIARSDPRGKGIDPEVAENLKLLPAPNNYDLGDGLNNAGFRFNNPAGQYGDQCTWRVDHNLWNGHRVFFRYTWDRSSMIDTVNDQDARFPGQPHGTLGGDKWAYAIGSDWALTTRLMNEFRIGYDVYAWDFLRPARLPGYMLLANSWTDPLNPSFGQSRRPAVRQFTDNVTFVRGKHTFKGGFEWRFNSQPGSNDAGIYPNVSFATTSGNSPSGTGPSGSSLITTADRQRFESLYNDLLGRMNQVTRTFYSDLEKFQPAGTPRVRSYKAREYGYFFQDDWRIHPRLVLNLGLRYEFSGVPLETNGLQGTVDKAALISHAARIGDFTSQRSSRWYNDDFNNFAPRIGLAWDFAGDGRTALRANWGIFYDRLIGATTNQVDTQTPGFSQVVTVYPNSPAGDVRVSDGVPQLSPPSAPPVLLPATRSTPLRMFTPNLRTGYVSHYSLTLQREVFRNTVVDAGFVGTHGVKLFMLLNLNQPRIYENFLAAFRELQAFRANGTPVPATNTLVRMFGSATAAVTAIGGNVIDLGAAGSAADSLDRTNYTRYAGAGVSDFYLRNFPQFSQLTMGCNDGRSYYDSFQFSLRRQAGALKFVANYTFSKSMDNISVDGNAFTSPIDNFNLRLNRARGDYDFPHSFNSAFIYTLPVGKGQRLGGGIPSWLECFLGGWDIGLLTIWQSGHVVTYTSGRATGPANVSSYADYSGDRNAGGVMRQGDGVYWLTPEEVSRFSYPAAGEIGTGGRNTFRGPRFFNADLSLVKKFKLTERHAFLFRVEAYNLANNANFAVPNANLAGGAAFGKIAKTLGDARVMQMALRYEF